jgi:hypothetical protein
VDGAAPDFGQFVAQARRVLVVQLVLKAFERVVHLFDHRFDIADDLVRDLHKQGAAGLRAAPGDERKRDVAQRRQLMLAVPQGYGAVRVHPNVDRHQFRFLDLGAVDASQHDHHNLVDNLNARARILGEQRLTD